MFNFAGEILVAYGDFVQVARLSHLFKAQGGFNRLNKIFNGRLQEVLNDLHDELWRDTA